MAFPHLLAKSCENPADPPEAATLLGHTRQVLEGAMVLNAVMREHILAQLSSEISVEMWDEAFLCSAWLHDIGKANDHFQTTLLDRTFRQGVRHETLGIIIIDRQLDDWLTDFWRRHPSWFKTAVLFAVAGHHLKFPDQTNRNGILRQDVIFLGDHPQFTAILQIGTEVLKLSTPPTIPRTKYSLRPFTELEINNLLAKVKRRHQHDFTPHQQLFVSALKSALMCADLAGSAMPFKNVSIADWLPSRLQSGFRGNELTDLVSRKVGDKPLKPFQKQVTDTENRTILIEAGCGSGKTVAAYQWAAKHAAGRKLFFCYPTTSTASEGFGNYLQDPGFESLLVHSRMTVDYRLLENLPRKTPIQYELKMLGLEAIDTWPAAAIVCTAHTVLGILQNVRRGIYAWPSLIRGVFVFDEIHSFSERLFSHLLRFLSVFTNVPVLLMTATLPPSRKDALLKICANRGGITTIYGPEERETAPRYALMKATENAAWEQCNSVIAAGGKVLWICNTIGRAMAISKHAHELNYPVEPYHSRYRYRDRLTRQRTVIDGFLPGRPAMLAVTTQVAEMSLDLSADLLISEYAPVPALIQRLGRLNRFEDIPETTSPALFVRPENALPYEKGEQEQEYWQRIESWLSLVADGKRKSQRDLFKAFLATETPQTTSLELPYSDWLDTPWKSETNKNALVEPGYTMEMIREEDLGKGLLAEMAIPMPIPRGKNWNWPAQGKYVIAPKGAINYDPFWGGNYAEADEFEII